MFKLHRLLFAALWGSVAGLVALALDQFLAFLTLGFFIEVAPRFIVLYALTGAVVAGLVETSLLLGRRQRGAPMWMVAVTLAVLYGLSVFERVHQALVFSVTPVVALTAATLAVFGYVMWFLLCRRLLRPETTNAETTNAETTNVETTVHALILVVLCVAVGLAVNRNLISHPLESVALVADFFIVAMGLGLLVVVRLAGPRPAALITVVLAAVMTLTVVFELWRDAAMTGTSQRSSAQPHLILVIIDTLRQDVFQSVVQQTVEGQAFRRAVGHAAWFDNAVSVAPWTPPSVASIMTGLFPPEHGFGLAKQRSKSRPLTRLSSSATTLAQKLSASGYQTLGIVANPFLHPVTGIARGFQRYELLADATTKMPLLTVLMRARLIDQGLYPNASSVRRRLRHRLPELTANGQPVFLWLHLMDPHSPLHGHPRLPPDGVDEKLPRDERFYRQETRYALDELTRMVELIKSNDLWQDAVFVLLADHGEMFASDAHDHLPPRKPTTYGHGHALYGELVQVPLVIRPPGGLPKERRVDALVSQTDLHDTLIDMLALDVPRLGRDRISLAPWLQPEPPTEPVSRTYTLMGATQSGPKHRAVRTEGLKFIQWPQGEMPEELYDLAADPGEKSNLASDRPGLRAELEELFDFAWAQLEPATDGGDLELSEETRQRLKALGYLD